MVDLHIHTNYSDGQYSVSELLDKLKEAGVTVFSITDHDEIGGCIEFESIKDEFSDVQFIRGIEFSTVHNGVKMHILGYGFDYSHTAFQNILTEIKEKRKARILNLVDSLNEKFGIEIARKEIDNLLNSKTSVGKPDIAKILINKGFAESIEDAFAKYLGQITFPNLKITAQQAIEAVSKSGGIAVLAHPKEIMQDYGLSYLQIEELINDLKNIGLRGIECYYSTHSEENTSEFIGIANKHNLLISCGSDFHGEEVKPAAKLGVVCKNISIVQDILDTFNIYM